jgi:hypothetical protein
MLVVLLKQANKKNESHLLDFGPIQEERWVGEMHWGSA